MIEIKEIYVDEQIKNLEITQNILDKLPNKNIIYTNNIPKVSEYYAIFLTKKKGSMVKKINYNPGIFKGKACYLIYQTNCLNNCVYCYLQDYFSTSKLVTIYINYQDLLSQIEETKKLYKIFYAGELNDSLLFDEITNYTKILIPFFEDKKDNLLELRTKTTNISNLLELNPNNQVIISFSLNPQSIIDLYEPKTASLIGRLKAARTCQEKGYKIAFHIDPIITIPCWQKEYKKLINLIKNFIPKRIEYISLGVLRYTKRLKDIIIKNHPDKGDILYSNEFFPSVDKKFRYFKPLRIKIYKYLLDILKELDTYPYLCMEEDSIKKLLSLKESYFS